MNKSWEELEDALEANITYHNRLRRVVSQMMAENLLRTIFMVQIALNTPDQDLIEWINRSNTGMNNCLEEMGEVFKLSGENITQIGKLFIKSTDEIINEYTNDDQER